MFAIFSSFKIFEFYHFFRQQGSRDLLQGLMTSCLIVSRVNGIVINILVTRVLAIF